MRDGHWIVPGEWQNFSEPLEQCRGQPVLPEVVEGRWRQVLPLDSVSSQLFLSS